MDVSLNSSKSYSFARTQLMWWSLIIISSYSIYYGLNQQVHLLNTSILILLGISLSTSTAAKLIDINDRHNNIMKTKAQSNGKSFLFDILSDKDGISIHRFQSFVFNVIFGLIFITTFSSTNKFYVFSGEELTLLGISSAGYLGVKLNENK